MYVDFITDDAVCDKVVIYDNNYSFNYTDYTCAHP